MGSYKSLDKCCPRLDPPTRCIAIEGFTGSQHREGTHKGFLKQALDQRIHFIE
jgi:hypothetical protein